LFSFDFSHILRLLFKIVYGENVTMSDNGSCSIRLWS